VAGAQVKNFSGHPGFVIDFIFAMPVVHVSPTASSCSPDFDKNWHGAENKPALGAV
jgi:hypothetical protein